MDGNINFARSYSLLNKKFFFVQYMNFHSKLLRRRCIKELFIQLFLRSIYLRNLFINFKKLMLAVETFPMSEKFCSQGSKSTFFSQVFIWLFLIFQLFYLCINRYKIGCGLSWPIVPHEQSSNFSWNFINYPTNKFFKYGHRPPHP